MRFRLGNRAILSTPIAHRRSFHHVPALTNGPIIENSLEKTLEEHRLLNRRSLIRKVYARSDLEKLDRLTEPRKKAAKAETSESSNSKSQTQLSEKDTQSPAFQEKSESLTEHNPGSPAPKSIKFPFITWQVKKNKSARSKYGPSRDTTQRPWLAELDQTATYLDGISHLDAELHALEAYLTPTVREKEVASQVVSDVINLISRYAGSSKSIRVSRTGFTMSHSTLDLIIAVSDKEKATDDDVDKPNESYSAKKRRQRKILDLAQRSLGQSSIYGLQLEKRERTLKVLHRPSGLVLQITCAEDEHTALEYLRDFHAEYPTLRSLYIAIRLLLESKGLFGTENTINCNELQLLIAAVLKMNHGRLRRDALVGESFLTFLYTFGVQRDLSATGIAVDPPGFFTTQSVEDACAMYNPDDIPALLRGQRSLIKTKRNAMKRGNRPLGLKLLIQNPANFMTQAPGSCSRTVETQGAFRKTYSVLKSALDAWEARPNNSILSAALNANFEGFETRRVSILATHPDSCKKSIS
ncbi:uncharacterized protein DSM5745_03825 [Aspergillus mulundensis]|uniref:Polynucleotide adenylyltransferase n=1 Tax=Aspergillus mulundensis TaxID=1810919 RepID=A0A3D8SLJ8_9EURO|nr:hypothetical protein DSM5745_03825 [Aspergillus mulundensis]RDW87183.1 hypothetical protein DSM5745_03825 [Aspergillus mulundensis]